MFRGQGCGTSRRNVDENSSFGYSGIVGRQEEDLGRPIQLHPPPPSRLPLPLTYSSVPDPALEGVGRKGWGGVRSCHPLVHQRNICFFDAPLPPSKCAAVSGGPGKLRRGGPQTRPLRLFCARNFREVEVRKETMRISDAASATVAATARPAGSPPDPQTTNTEVLRPPGYRDQDRQGFQSMPSR